MRHNEKAPLLGCFSLSKKSVLHAVPVYTAGQRLPLEGKLAAKPTDEVANKKLGKSRNFCQKSRISTSSAQCAHWAPSPQGEGLRKRSPFLAVWFFDRLKKELDPGQAPFFSSAAACPGSAADPAGTLPSWQRHSRCPHPRCWAARWGRAAPWAPGWPWARE